MKAKIAVIGLQQSELRQLEQRIALFPGAAVTRQFPHYPQRSELERYLRAVDPDILLISTEIPSQMEAGVSQAAEMSPSLQVVIVDANARPNILQRAMQLGVRECLMIPFIAQEVAGVIERCMQRRAAGAPRTGTNCLYTFLPARGGVGATSLAVQTALSLPTDEGHRGLLVDADIEAGLIQFLLKADNAYSLIETLERVEDLDEILWPKLVTERGNLDVLHAGTSGEDYRPDLGRLQRLLAFARMQYSMILVDLPSIINRLTIELMQQSKTIFLVTTSEIASLHMARRRFRSLQEMQLGEQVRLIVNSTDRYDVMPVGEVAAAVGLPVQATFVHDHAEVQKSILSGNRIPASRPLGRQLTEFAGTLLRDPVVKPAKKRGLLEMFSTPHHAAS